MKPASAFYKPGIATKLKQELTQSLASYSIQTDITAIQGKLAMSTASSPEVVMKLEAEKKKLNDVLDRLKAALGDTGEDILRWMDFLKEQEVSLQDAPGLRPNTELVRLLQKLQFDYAHFACLTEIHLTITKQFPGIDSVSSVFKMPVQFGGGGAPLPLASVVLGVDPTAGPVIPGDKKARSIVKSSLVPYCASAQEEEVTLTEWNLHLEHTLNLLSQLQLTKHPISKKLLDLRVKYCGLARLGIEIAPMAKSIQVTKMVDDVLKPLQEELLDKYPPTVHTGWFSKPHVKVVLEDLNSEIANLQKADRLDVPRLHGLIFDAYTKLVGKAESDILDKLRNFLRSDVNTFLHNYERHVRDNTVVHTMTLGLIKANSHLEKEKQTLVAVQDTLIQEKNGLVKKTEVLEDEKVEAVKKVERERKKKKDFKQGLAEVSMYIPADKREEVAEKLKRANLGDQTIGVFNQSMMQNHSTIQASTQEQLEKAYKDWFSVHMKVVLDKAKSLLSGADETTQIQIMGFLFHFHKIILEVYILSKKQPDIAAVVKQAVQACTEFKVELSDKLLNGYGTEVDKWPGTNGRAFAKPNDATKTLVSLYVKGFIPGNKEHKAYFSDKLKPPAQDLAHGRK
jgi:hypothetical protein